MFFSVWRRFYILLNIFTRKRIFMVYRKGFTLIELLVVVLIIGIVAAVALPQYQNAVNKSKAAQAYIALKALAGAQERYFLETGDYAARFDQLDVSMDPACTDTQCTIGNYIYRLYGGEQKQLAVYLGGDLSSWATADMSISYFYSDPDTSSVYYTYGVTKGYYMCDHRNKPNWAKLCATLSTGANQFINGNKYFWKP